MKLKKINIVELHIEKLIALIVFGGVIWILITYVLGGPYNIERDNKVLKPSEVENDIVAKSKDVEVKIQDKADNPLPDLSIPNYGELFEKRLNAPILEVDSYVAPLSWPGVREIIQVKVNRQPIGIPLPPNVTNMTISYGHYLLQDASYDDYLNIEAAPRDIWAASIAAEFPTPNWQEKLVEFEQKVGIDMLDKVRVLVDVKIERQIKRGDVFGAYVEGAFEEGSIETIRPLPNTPDNKIYLERERWDIDDGKAFLAKLKTSGEQSLILRPEFPNLDSLGPKWKKPEGYTDSSASAATPVATPTPATDESGKVQLKPVPIIAHDLTLKAGNTYRFRLVATALNPAFQELNLPNVPDIAKQRLGVISQQNSAWSDEVVIPKTQFIFVSDTTSKKATIEIWQLFGGKWVSSQFEVEPGQMVAGSSEVQSDRYSRIVEHRTRYMLVDLIELPGGGIRGPEYKAVLMNTSTGEVDIRSPRQEVKKPLRSLLEQSDFKKINDFQ